MSKRPVANLLADMVEAIEKIRRYVQGMDLDAFIEDERTSDAVVRNLEIIGEAAARLPEEFTGSHASIPWAQIVGLRNRIVHGYFGIDLSLVWNIITHDIPPLHAQLQNLLRA